MSPTAAQAECASPILSRCSAGLACGAGIMRGLNGAALLTLPDEEPEQPKANCWQCRQPDALWVAPTFSAWQVFANERAGSHRRATGRDYQR